MVAKALKASQIVYAKLVARKSILIPTQTQQNWTEECNMEGDKCIKRYEAYQSALKCNDKTGRISIQISAQTNINQWLFNKNWNKRQSRLLLL